MEEVDGPALGFGRGAGDVMEEFERVFDEEEEVLVEGVYFEFRDGGCVRCRRFVVFSTFFLLDVAVRSGGFL